MNFNLLKGERVTLIPLELEHADLLFECSRSPRIWEHLPIKVQTRKEMDHYIQTAILGREREEEYPFAVYDKKLNKMVGMTRYLRISHIHMNLNVGWTWYSPEVWRTQVNTECKYLLLKFAFGDGKLFVSKLSLRQHINGHKRLLSNWVQREKEFLEKNIMD